MVLVFVFVVVGMLVHEGALSVRRRVSPGCGNGRLRYQRVILEHRERGRHLPALSTRWNRISLLA